MTTNHKSFPKKTISDYDKIRPEIRSGDILLCSGSGWFSKMIQGASNSIWSHVAFVMRLDIIDRVMVLESVEPLGVRTVPLSKYLKDYDSKGHPYPGGLAILRHKEFENIVSKEDLIKMGQFAVKLFGYPYDKDEIAKIAARIAMSHIPFTKKDKEKILKRDNEYICSEYVWENYNSLGIEIDYDKRGFIAPADFAKDKNFKLQYVLKNK
jgi:hypothetical protein